MHIRHGIRVGFEEPIRDPSQNVFERHVKTEANGKKSGKKQVVLAVAWRTARGYLNTRRGG